jgi:GT2 family glycosyltransferase
MGEKPSLGTPAGSSAGAIQVQAAVSRPLIGIAILNYNNATDTIECLKSLRDSEVVRQGVIAVVDNASSDDSAHVIRTWLAKQEDTSSWYEICADDWSVQPAQSAGGVVFYAHSSNDGYGAGNNIALRILREVSPDWYWILNNDTVVTPGDLRRLVQQLRTRCKKPEILGTRIHTAGTRGGEDILGGGIVQRWLGRTLPSRANSRHRRRPYERLDFISGASMLVSADALDRVGPLVEDHFLFWEEADYAWRARSRGCVLDVLDDVTVTHHHGRVSGANPTSKTPLAHFYSSRSAILYFRRHEPVLLPIAVAARWLHCLALLARGRHRAARAIGEGILSGLRAQASNGEPREHTQLGTRRAVAEPASVGRRLRRPTGGDDPYEPPAPASAASADATS